MSKESDTYIDDIANICYECTGYGDDYYMDDDGNLVSACDDCWVNRREEEE